MLPLFAGLYGPRWLAAGVLLVIAAVVFAAVISQKRGRKSVLHAEALPILIGQRFIGHVDVELDQVLEEDFWLVLRCTEPDPGSEYGAIQILWQDELTVDATAVARMGRRLRIPFSFEMPAVGKPSAVAVKWELQISTGGYAARFQLPVISGDVPPATRDERPRIFSSVRDSLRR